MAVLHRCCLLFQLLLLCSGLPLENNARQPLRAVRRSARRELPADRAGAQLPANASTSKGAAPEQLDSYLASCGFTAAEMPGDHAKPHTPSSACSILGKLDGLVLVGDSLTRQLYEALVQLLRGDLARGALRPDVAADVAERCKCKEQANKDCRLYTEAWPPSLAWLDGAPLLSAELRPCAGAPDFRMQFFHMYQGWTHEDSMRDHMILVRGLACQRPNTVVIVAGAPTHGQRDRDDDPWVKMDAGFSARQLIAPLLAIARQCDTPAHNLVWAPMHWFDIDKVPEQWRKGQYPKDILRYNRLTSAAARAGNLTVFDTYNMTKGGATLDGVHVPAPVSLAKLQLLLSMIEARQAAAAAST